MSKFNARNVRLSALVLAASAFAATQMAGNAQAYQCKPGYVQAETIATLKAKSKSSGRKLWTSNVKNSLGLEWSVWDIASNAVAGLRVYRREVVLHHEGQALPLRGPVTVADLRGCLRPRDAAACLRACCSIAPDGRS